jgi:dihydrofolate reductase
MRKLIAKAWLTLDGIFDADSMDKWFNPYHSDARAQHIQHTIHESDAFIYGRATYDMLAPYWSTLENNEFGIADRLNKVPKYVVSTTLQSADWNNAHIISGDVADEIARLKQQDGESILIDGSASVVRSLLPTGLIDEFRLVVHPVVMGRGNRYFTPDMDLTRLELVSVQTLPLGVVTLCYQRAAAH